MIHSPWSYEVYTCQLNSKYGSGEIEKGIIVYTVPINKSSKVIEDLDGKGSYGIPVETFYPGTNAKMYVYITSENAEARIVFVKKDKLVVIQTPMNQDKDGNVIYKIMDIYKPTIDLIMSTIKVK